VCGPCKGFARFSMRSEKHSDIVFGKVNTDDEQELPLPSVSARYRTLMLFREKVILFSQAGALPGSALEQVTQGKRARYGPCTRTLPTRGRRRPRAGLGESGNKKGRSLLPFWCVEELTSVAFFLSSSSRLSCPSLRLSFRPCCHLLHFIFFIGAPAWTPRGKPLDTAKIAAPSTTIASHQRLL